MDSKSPGNNGINRKALRVLEYGKIIAMLRGEACSGLTRALIDALEPSRDPAWIREELANTDEAVTVILRKGTPPFGNFYDIGGFGSGDLWFRLQTSPCYPVENVKKLLGADRTPLGERGFRYENARCVISVLADENRVECVSVLQFLPVELAAPRKPV